MQALAQASGGRLIALDGQTLRRSFDKANGKAVIHMVIPTVPTGTRML